MSNQKPNPNWPSKNSGNSSGGGRGNNPPANKPSGGGAINRQIKSKTRQFINRDI